MTLPTPHLDKLTAAIANDKLPSKDKPVLEAAVAKYQVGKTIAKREGANR